MWIDSWGLIGWIGIVGCILMDFDELDWRGDGGVGWNLWDWTGLARYSTLLRRAGGGAFGSGW